MNQMQIQILLTPFLHNGASIEEMLNASEDILKTPIRFAPNGDLRRAITSRSYPANDTDQVYSFYANSTSTDEARRKREVCFEYFHNETSKLVMDQATGNRKILARVVVNGHHLGHVALPEVDTDLRTLSLDAVEEICRYIGLAVMIQSFHLEETTSADLLKCLLSETITSPIDWKLNERLIKQPNTWFRLYFFSGPLRGSSFFDQMEEHIHTLFPEEDITRWEGGIVLLTWRSNRLPEEKDKMAVSRILRENVCRCIYSPAFSEIFECRTWLDRLRRMLAFPELRDVRQIDYDLNRALVLLHEVNQEGRSLSPYVSEYVREMMLHDEKHGTHYLDTLRAYLAGDRSYEATADILGVHINTVQYRVRRMQEIFGLWLGSSDIQFQMMLSLRILDICADG